MSEVQKPRLARALEYLEVHEGLGITVVIAVAFALILAMVLSLVTIDFVVNQTQCKSMCAVAGDVGKETSEGCVCASPDGERWSHPPTIKMHTR